MSGRRERLFSLPREHGAWLTLAGALIVGLVIAPERAAASGLALCVTAAFFARGPLEQHAVGRATRDDAIALGLLGLLGGVGALLAGRVHPRFAFAGLAIVAVAAGVSYLARRLRRHRDPAFELAGMGALGAACFPVAVAGGAPAAAALLPAIVLAIHAAAAVPLVRSEIRPGERARRGRANALAALLLAAGALAVVLLGHPFASLAFLPRLAQVALRRAGALQVKRPALIGARETVLLALAALVVVAVP